MSGQIADSCPHCGTDGAVAILYGPPTAETLDEAAAGRVVLGGRSASPDDPTRTCRNCRSEWATSAELEETALRERFAEYFRNWSIELPPGAVAAGARGTIHKAGWLIRYRFDGEGGESYLEFYATHRMTDDRHVKINASGDVETLNSIVGEISYDPRVPGSEERARKRNRVHNEAVVAELRRKRLYPTEDVNAFLRTGGGEAMNALEEMEQLLSEANLPFPPVPNALRYKMRKLRDWSFATCDVEAMDLYFFRDQLVDLLQSPPQECVALCHAGHGVNSYAINYQLVYRNLVLLVQSPWGGVYTDREKATERLSQMFEQCAELVALAEEHGLPRHLLVAHSSMRMMSLCDWMPSPIAEKDVKPWLTSHLLRGIDPFPMAKSLILQDRRSEPPSRE